MRSTSRSHAAEIAPNGTRRSTLRAAESTPSSSRSDVGPAMSASRSGEMSKRSQLVVIAASTLAFTGLLVYLSSVLYPLAVLGGAYFIMQQHEALEDGGRGFWNGFRTRVVQQYKAFVSPTTDLATEKPAASRDDSKCVDLSKMTKATGESDGSSSPVTKHRSRVIAVKNSTGVASLRVTDMGVTSDGTPQEVLEGSEELLDSIVQPNSAEPYEFENDYMKGRLLFLLQRQEEALPAKYASLFDGKRRLFWIQMQVQFKKVPSGILYIGGEVPRSMNLGFFTGGLTKIILSVLQSLVRGLHCSFGRIYPTAVSAKEEEELPHICFPLYTAVDQFVVTPPGDTPPTLGSADFGESKEDMAARRKRGQPMYQYNTTDTYSFHFHSFFIDFAKWRLNGIPGMKDCDLSVFWEDMPLHLCAYSLKPSPGVDPNSEAEAKKAIHSWRAKEYKFCFQLSHKIQDEYQFVDDAYEHDQNAFTSSDRRISEVISQQREVQDHLSRYDFSVPAWFEYFSTSPAHAERRVGYAVHVREYEHAASPSESSKEQIPREEYFVLLSAVTAFSPLSFIEKELTSGGRQGSGRGGVVPSAKSKTLEESISVKSRSSRYGKVDEERQFLENQLTRLARKETSSSTTSHFEHLLQAQSCLLEILQDKVKSVGYEWPFLTSAYVRRNSFGSSINVINDVGVSTANAPVKDALQAASQIVRALSPTCWRNEWVTIDKTQRVLRFFRMMASTCSAIVAIDSIYAIEEDDMGGEGSSAASDIHWLRLITIEKCHHIAFASRDDRQQWRQSIIDEVQVVGNSLESLVRQPIIVTSRSVEPEAFLSNSSSKSRGAKRYLMNDRCEFTMGHALSPSVKQSANDIVASALRQALRLHRERLNENSTKYLLKLLDTVGMLKTADLTPVQQDETERKVFLVNLYHLMLIHASLLGFLPRSKAQWGKFFNGMSYNVGGLLLSIAEVEHGLIRAPMASLKLAIAFLIIPKISDQDERSSLKLTKPDYRLNFALNCMTKSCTNSIMVFTPADLERQLDHMTSITVDYLVSYDRESKIVYLPKVCEWYRADFTSDSSNRWQRSILTEIRKYMTGEKAQLVDYLLHHDQTLVSKWKFAKYDYRFHESLYEASPSKG